MILFHQWRQHWQRFYKRHRFHVRVVALSTVGGLGLLYLGIQQFYIAPARRAINQLGVKLSQVESLNYRGQFKFTGQDFLSLWQSDIGFSGQFEREDDWKLDSDFVGVWAGKNYTGQAQIGQDQLFFKLSGPDLPVIRFNQTANLYRVTNDWHRAATSHSLYSLICETRPDSQYPDGLALLRFYRTLKLKPSWWVDYTKLGDQSAVHFHGTVDSESLGEAVQRLNQSLPGSCRLPYADQDFKYVRANWELWTSPAHDRFKVVLQDQQLGAEVELTLDMDQYDQPVRIVPPPSSVDLDALRRAAIGR